MSYKFTNKESQEKKTIADLINCIKRNNALPQQPKVQASKRKNPRGKGCYQNISWLHMWYSRTQRMKKRSKKKKCNWLIKYTSSKVLQILTIVLFTSSRCDIVNANNTKCLKPSLRLSTENFNLFFEKISIFTWGSFEFISDFYRVPTKCCSLS